MSAFLVAGVVALIRNSASGAFYCGVIALLALYGAIPKRPSQNGGLQLREVLVTAVLIDGFVIYLITDFFMALPGESSPTWRDWLDLPMLAIACIFGYAATRGAVKLARGEHIADRRRTA
jgi:hypothetical protein